ncbi:transposable element Tcb2 transposase [Trichonephila clavipes]|nr:transposable element Tcb2 transposase [Trichonephila clavipes]
MSSSRLNHGLSLHSSNCHPALSYDIYKLSNLALSFTLHFLDLVGKELPLILAPKNPKGMLKKRRDLEPFLETGSAGRRPGQSRRRATTPNEYRYLVLTARRDRNKNATLLQQHLRSATGSTISTQSVRNRLHGVGVYARRPMVCIRLTSRHRRDRREWATEHVN